MPRLSKVSALLALALLSCGVGAYAAATIKAEPTATAAVNVERVLNALNEKTQIEAEFQTRQEQLMQEQSEREDELKQIRQDLEILAPGTEAFDQKRESFEKKAMEFKVWQEFNKGKIEREHRIEIEALYRKLVDTVGRLAEEQGYDMVVFQEPEIDFRGANVKQILDRIERRKVIWHRDELDITDALIQRMNNEFDSK